MSRNDALVDIRWAGRYLGDDNVSAYEGDHIAVRADRKTELKEQVEGDFVDQPGYAKLLSQKAIAGNDFDSRLGTDLLPERPGRLKEAA